MARRLQVNAGTGRASLYNNTNLTTAISSVAQPAIVIGPNVKALMLEAQFVYGSGGTSADVYVQTSIDGGLSWFDIANFHFLLVSANKLSAVVWDPATPFPAGTTPGSGALASNTVLNGILGDQIRALVNTSGTYGGSTSIRVDAVAKG